SNPKPPPKGPPHTDVAGLSCTPESNAMNPDQPITELFTQPGCMPCKAVERKLVQYSIPYIVHDITRDENARERVRALGYTQTPVVLASDGTSFSGLHL